MEIIYFINCAHFVNLSLGFFQALPLNHLGLQRKCQGMGKIRIKRFLGLFKGFLTFLQLNFYA
jgi:hypothetical protein